MCVSVHAFLDLRRLPWLTCSIVASSQGFLIFTSPDSRMWCWCRRGVAVAAKGKNLGRPVLSSILGSPWPELRLNFTFFSHWFTLFSYHTYYTSRPCNHSWRRAITGDSSFPVTHQVRWGIGAWAYYFGDGNIFQILSELYQFYIVTI